MTQKEAFTNIINYLFEQEWIKDEFEEEELSLAIKFWEDFKNKKNKSSNGLTENGVKVLKWMQENIESMTNIFTSKDIAEGIFSTGRSVSGSMRKLVGDGLVEKIGKDPVQYSLTENGKMYVIEN